MMDFLLDTFVELASIDSYANVSQKSVRPSSQGQMDVLQRIEHILQGLGGIYDIEYKADILIATIAGDSDDNGAVAFMSHVDVTSDFHVGTKVKPLVWPEYDGGILHLPLNNVTLDPNILPHLADAKGDTIITGSGDSVLGADDKAGVVIMLALARDLLCQDISLSFPPRRRQKKTILYFVPDGEIVGFGTAHRHYHPDVLQGIFPRDCQAVYILDAGDPGDVRWETMSTYIVTIIIDGYDMHTSFAKGTEGHGKLYERKMVNALSHASKLIADVTDMGLSPENVDGRAGFIHFFDVAATVRKAEIKAWIRAFEHEEVDTYVSLLAKLCKNMNLEGDTKAHSSPLGCSMYLDHISRNIAKRFENSGWLPVQMAEQAMYMEGMSPVSTPIRGNTDASFIDRYYDVPVLHLYSAWHGSHGPMEWVSVQELNRMVSMLHRLLQMWTEVP